MTPVQSSCIAAIGYVKANRLAIVQFKSGNTYAYENVHPTTVTRWLKAKSIGIYFHRNIKGAHRGIRCIVLPQE